jgi:hypothetical protein
MLFYLYVYVKSKYQKLSEVKWSEVKWSEEKRSAVNVYTKTFSNYVLRWEYCLVISLVSLYIDA